MKFVRHIVFGSLVAALLSLGACVSQKPDTDTESGEAFETASQALSGPSSWQATGSMKDARGLHTANKLPSGKVAVVGGISLGQVSDIQGRVVTPNVEVYDPSTGVFNEVDPLNTSR